MIKSWRNSVGNYFLVNFFRPSQWCADSEFPVWCVYIRRILQGLFWTENNINQSINFRNLAYSGLAFLLISIAMIALGVVFCIALYTMYRRLDKQDFAKSQVSYEATNSLENLTSHQQNMECYTMLKEFMSMKWTLMIISMVYCKKDVTPLLTHWGYVSLALTHQHVDITVGSWALFQYKDALSRSGNSHYEDKMIYWTWAFLYMYWEDSIFIMKQPFGNFVKYGKYSW